jgi:hypothetical protein
MPPPPTPVLPSGDEPPPRRPVAALVGDAVKRSLDAFAGEPAGPPPLDEER